MSLLHKTWKDVKGYCSLCEKHITNTSNWKKHLKTRKHLINENKDRHTRIFSSSSDLSNAGYIDSSKYDLRATKWYSPDNHKVGLVFH